MADISLLPEDMREKELKKEKKPMTETSASGLKMHVPENEPEEDIEIIEVDESDLGSVLADEPFMTRFTYQIGVAFDKMRDKLSGKKEKAPPPKLPPQFFGAKKSAVSAPPGSAPQAGTPHAGEAPPKGAPQKPGRVSSKLGVRIAPSTAVPRRVRVIKRKRHPVRVSLISEEQLAELRINVSKRKWTLSVVVLLYAAIIGGGWSLISQQLMIAQSSHTETERQLTETRDLIRERLDRWKEFEDLEPRLVLLDGILTNHVVISRLFDFLEMRTLPTVVYRSATLNTDGQLILDVNADSYEDAARQLVSFEESDNVSQVDATQFASRITGSGEDERATVAFQLLLTLDMARLRGPLLVQDSMGSMPGASSAQSTTP